jgi:hypothetical protein
VSSSGTGAQDVTWTPESGDWTLVVMNDGGSALVDADVAVGAEVPVVDDVAVGLLVVGALMVLMGAGLLVWAVRP